MAAFLQCECLGKAVSTLDSRKQDQLQHSSAVPGLQQALAQLDRSDWSIQ